MKSNCLLGIEFKTKTISISIIVEESSWSYFFDGTQKMLMPMEMCNVPLQQKMKQTKKQIIQSRILNSKKEEPNPNLNRTTCWLIICNDFYFFESKYGISGALRRWQTHLLQ
jgi:hypothetical protein